MTVVVPPSKASDEKNGDVTMNGTGEEKEEEVPVDPKVKAANGKMRMCTAYSLVANARCRHQEQPGSAGTSRHAI